MNKNRLQHVLSKLPVHLVIIGIMLIWIIPALGLLVTSFRPVQDVNTTGWWTVFTPPPGQTDYARHCAECHGNDGQAVCSQSAARGSPILFAGDHRGRTAFAMGVQTGRSRARQTRSKSTQRALLPAPYGACEEAGFSGPYTHLVAGAAAAPCRAAAGGFHGGGGVIRWGYGPPSVAATRPASHLDARLSGRDHGTLQCRAGRCA